jgi:hypothetical protein
MVLGAVARTDPIREVVTALALTWTSCCRSYALPSHSMG